MADNSDGKDNDDNDVDDVDDVDTCHDEIVQNETELQTELDSARKMRS